MPYAIMMSSKLRNVDTWGGHGPNSLDPNWDPNWDPGPAGPVIGLATSLAISALAWLLVVAIAMDFLG